MAARIANSVVWRKLHRVGHFDLHKVREEVAALKGKVLDDKIK